MQGYRNSCRALQRGSNCGSLSQLAIGNVEEPAQAAADHLELLGIAGLEERWQRSAEAEQPGIWPAASNMELKLLDLTQPRTQPDFAVRAAARYQETHFGVAIWAFRSA